MNYLKFIQNRFAKKINAELVDKECGRKCKFCDIMHYKSRIDDYFNKSYGFDSENGKFRYCLLRLILSKPMVSESIQLQHTWSEEARSSNVRLFETNPFQFFRLPERNRTDGIRGKIGYTHGFHVWHIYWSERCRGTHATIGVSTANSLLDYDDYVSLVGIDSESWGWDITKLCKVHDLLEKNGCMEPYPTGINKEKLNRSLINDELKIPTKITVILDMDRGNLSFMIDGMFLGIAFDGLQGKTLYPSVGSVWGRSRVTLRYYGGIEDPPTLKELAQLKFMELMHYHCVYNIHNNRQSLQNNHTISTETDLKKIVKSLNIPKSLKNSVLKNIINVVL